MKKLIFAVTTLLFVALYAISGMAEDSTVELGKQLFNDPTLANSTNERTCNTCHDNGDGLKHSGNKENLTKTINRCIIGPLKGTKLDNDSLEMHSLEMYIKSLGE